MKKIFTITFLCFLTVSFVYSSGCSKSSSSSVLPRIVRDSYGVAHIYAGNDYSLFYGVGWADAQDRLVQMELMRRAGSGTLAEILGTLALGVADVPLRQYLYYTPQEREDAFNAITDTTIKDAITAYCDGINAYMRSIYSDPTYSKVPFEFFQLGSYLKSLTSKYGLPGGVTYKLLSNGTHTVFEPGPWIPEDVIAVIDLLVDFFGTGGGRQLQDLGDLNYLKNWFQTTPPGMNSTDATTYATQVFDDIRWLNDPDAPTTIPNNTPGGTAIMPNGSMKTTPQVPPGVSLTSLNINQMDYHAADQFAFLASIPQSSIHKAINDFYGNLQKIKEFRKDMGVFFTEGSNAWAVTPTLSATGSALLWGGPQEGFSMPNIDNEMYLHSPDVTVGGMKIPGEPVILIGMTRNYGWTTTSGEIEDSTIYVEQVDTAGTGFTTNPQTANSNYSVLYNSSYVPVTRIVDTIHYAGENPSASASYLDQSGNPTGPGPIAYNVFRVDDSQHFHGPVISFDLANGYAYTYRVAFWKTEYSTVEGFAGMNNAKNWLDFNNAVAKVVSLHNFMYADQLGNISYWSAGSEPNFPKGYDDRLPSCGAGTSCTGGSQEWTAWPNGQMFIPYSNWLYSVNPPNGYLVNWNTKPLNVPGIIMEGNGGDEHWGQIYRSDRMAFLISHNPNKLTVADMENIEKDVGTINGNQNATIAGPYFVPFIENAYNNLKNANDPLVTMTTSTFITQAVDILNKWNTYFTDPTRIFTPAGYSITYGVSGYSPVIGQPGAMIFAMWWEDMQKALYGGMMSGILGECTYNMLLHLFDTPNTGVPVNFTGTTAANYLTGMTGFIRGSYFSFSTIQGTSIPSDRDHIIIYALQQAMNQLAQGNWANGSQSPPGYNSGNPTTWGYIPVDDIDFDSMDVFEGTQLPMLIGQIEPPLSFGKSPSQNRSTYMQIINLTNPIFGENVIAPGENGFVQYNSDGKGTVGQNFGDQVDLFNAFAYKPMDIN